MNKRLITEESNPDTINLDKMSTNELCKIINDNDKIVAHKVEEQLDVIVQVIDMVAKALKEGGRLFYIGSGTSGRIGIIDATECPPTFGVSTELVQGIIAGGRPAMFIAREGCEDKLKIGARDLMRRGFNKKDVLIGLSTSGRTPYVYGALKKAKSIGAKTAVIICNPEGILEEMADIAIKVVTGPEVLTGSTRMKAGTAEKMVLNMISTSVMIKLGRIKNNLMINMNINNTKLIQRAVNFIIQETGINEDDAYKFLKDSGNNLHRAIQMIKKD